MVCPEAVQDGLRHPEILKLAAIGANGTEQSHCSRDLVRLLIAAFKALPEVSLVSVPLVDTKENKQLNIELECQFPHDIFAYYAQQPVEFHQLFGTLEEP